MIPVFDRSWSACPPPSAWCLARPLGALGRLAAGLLLALMIAQNGALSRH